MRILIAEDDMVSRHVLQGVLRDAGHEVIETCNGREALEALDAPDAPQLVLLDWMMPEMDGVTLCRALRAAETDTPPYIILVTNKSDTQDIVEGLEAGANDYVSKPFDARELLARLQVGQRVVTLQRKVARHVAELQDALDHIKRLQGVLPICSSCHKIRDDQEIWQALDEYLTEHTDAMLSHGLCPECMKRLYPDLVDENGEVIED